MVKKVLSYSSFILFFVLFVHACDNNESQLKGNHVHNPATASDPQSKDGLPKFKFENTTHDFGKVIQGEKVSYTFTFTNVGDSDLVISNIGTSCGCTAGKYDKKPIAPGMQGEIEVSFDSEGRRGFQNKVVRVTANTQPNLTILNIKSMVIIPEEM